MSAPRKTALFMSQVGRGWCQRGGLVVSERRTDALLHFLDIRLMWKNAGSGERERGKEREGE